ncbi:hypothetical protein OH77DRAFT_1019244 [Trametes cingulata]|nr:hypothetical protein OH77DRAFT_1019244 [Trametes cingulata]
MPTSGSIVSHLLPRAHIQPPAKGVPRKTVKRSAPRHIGSSCRSDSTSYTWSTLLEDPEPGPHTRVGPVPTSRSLRCGTPISPRDECWGVLVRITTLARPPGDFSAFSTEIDHPLQDSSRRTEAEQTRKTLSSTAPPHASLAIRPSRSSQKEVKTQALDVSGGTRSSEAAHHARKSRHRPRARSLRPRHRCRRPSDNLLRSPLRLHAPSSGKNASPRMLS